MNLEFLCKFLVGMHACMPPWVASKTKKDAVSSESRTIKLSFQNVRISRFHHLPVYVPVYVSRYLLPLFFHFTAKFQSPSQKVKESIKDHIHLPLQNCYGSRQRSHSHFQISFHRLAQKEREGRRMSRKYKRKEGKQDATCRTLLCQRGGPPFAI